MLILRIREYDKVIDDVLYIGNPTERVKVIYTAAYVSSDNVTYNVVEGANQTVIGRNNARFKIDADFSLFHDGSVYVDGVQVSAKHFNTNAEEKLLELKKEYLNTLSDGEHTLKVVFKDGGTATTKFIVAKDKLTAPKTGDNLPEWIGKLVDYILYIWRNIKNILMGHKKWIIICNHFFLRRP